MSVLANDLAMLDYLIEWFDKVRTPYPFRQDRNPYRVWISEVVLQQTRIQAALQSLARFLQDFPDIKSLASANLDEVLQSFRGLGYYSRAKNLHKAAKYLMQNCHGELPTCYEQLKEVPSIGPYTAAAISSICFGERRPVVDGNIKRIIARIKVLPIAFTDSKLATECLMFLSPLFADMQHPPGTVNEAMMELGQKCCTPKNPNCQSCPVMSWCQAFQQEKVSQFPILKPKPAMTEVHWWLYILVKHDKIYLQRWENFYFLKGQWSFPSKLEFPNHQIMYSWDSSLLPIVKPIEYLLPEVYHTITHHRITIHPLIVKIIQMPKKKKQNSTEPHSAGPHSAEPHSIEPHSAEPHSIEPHSAEPHSIEPHSVGPHSIGPDDLTTNMLQEAIPGEWVSQIQVQSRLVSSALLRVWGSYQKDIAENNLFSV